MENKILGKIRSKFLDNKSFHVGFQNRSPFSYSNKYAGNWTPPVREATSEDPSQWDTGDLDLMEAKIGLVDKIAGEVTKVADQWGTLSAQKKKCEEGGGTWDRTKIEGGNTKGACV